MAKLKWDIRCIYVYRSTDNRRAVCTGN